MQLVQMAETSTNATAKPLLAVRCDPIHPKQKCWLKFCRECLLSPLYREVPCISSAHLQAQSQDDVVWTWQLIISCNLQSPWYPLYDKITPDNLVTSLTSLFTELDSSIDHLEGSHYASWQDTVNPFEEINDRMNVAWAVVDHLQVCHQLSRERCEDTQQGPCNTA